jgi:hypothetical protein
VRSMWFAGILCLIAAGFVGCSVGIKPATREIQRDTAPTSESIGEFLDLIQLDDVVDRFINAEKGVLEERFARFRAKSHLTAAQADIRDEFFGRAISVLDETLTRELIRQILTVTIQGSFTQRDIDALSTFYRTQSGKTIVAELKTTIRPYVQERHTRNEVIGADREHDVQDRLAPIIRVFSRAAELHEMAQFYGTDIDYDITSRLPKARALYEAQTETVEAEFQARIRQLIVEYQAKIKSVSVPRGVPVGK